MHGSGEQTTYLKENLTHHLIISCIRRLAQWQVHWGLATSIPDTTWVGDHQQSQTPQASNVYHLNYTASLDNQINNTIEMAEVKNVIFWPLTS